jgi:peptidoglycan/LPS O-acetylase OafA/YrhL
VLQFWRGSGYRLERVTNSLLPHRSDQNVRYPILDALRFALAFWAVMEHFGMLPVFSAVDANSIFGWFALYAFVLALAYLFYLLVERPSHQMARRIALVKKSVPVAVKEEALQSSPL